MKERDLRVVGGEDTDTSRLVGSIFFGPLNALSVGSKTDSVHIDGIQLSFCRRLQLSFKGFNGSIKVAS